MMTLARKKRLRVINGGRVISGSISGHPVMIGERLHSIVCDKAHAHRPGACCAPTCWCRGSVGTKGGQQ